MIAVKIVQCKHNLFHDGPDHHHHLLQTEGEDTPPAKRHTGSDRPVLQSPLAAFNSQVGHGSDQEDKALERASTLSNSLGITG